MTLDTSELATQSREHICLGPASIEAHRYAVHSIDVIKHI